MWLLVWSLDYWRLDAGFFLSRASTSRRRVERQLPLLSRDRHYLRATNVVQPVMFALVSAEPDQPRWSTGS